ncbi:RGS1-HXK1-interacting protein 1 [Chlorella vulgaris]
MSSDDSKPNSSPEARLGAEIQDLKASAGEWCNLWDGKLGEASKALESQLKSATGTAEAALDAGISAASDAVRAGVSAASRESDAVKSRLTQFYETGLAHYEATEQQALDAVKQGIRFVKHEHPQASMAAGVAAFFVLLPGPRRFLFRQTIGRFRSEEAMFRSAEQRYASLKETVEGQQGELQKLQASDGCAPVVSLSSTSTAAAFRALLLQERLQLAELEYQRGRSKLKSTAGELESLASRVRSSNKVSKSLVRDLRELPSKAALQLRSDAATAAATASGQAKVLDKALWRVAKQYGL